MIISGWKIGYIYLINVAFGHSHGFGERFGLRYYGSFYLSGATMNVDFVNVDALFSVVKGENAKLRVFAGGWLGWANHFNSYYDDTNNSGLDLGVNAGLRFVFAQRHGFEFYGRFGFLQQKQEYNSFRTWKASQPYQIGVRYTISF